MRLKKHAEELTKWSWRREAGGEYEPAGRDPESDDQRRGGNCVAGLGVAACRGVGRGSAAPRLILDRQLNITARRSRMSQTNVRARLLIPYTNITPSTHIFSAHIDFTHIHSTLIYFTRIYSMLFILLAFIALATAQRVPGQSQEKSRANSIRSGVIRLRLLY